jgi:peptidoglycan/xylan/chitin deacetylase (PgdA/CDA1 family)
MRDLLKKAVLGSGLLRLAAGFRDPGVAILMYHSVMENPAEQDDLLGGIIHSRSAFRQQMELLARYYRPISLDQVKNYACGAEKIPHRAVAVTFDDGYADNYEVAAPILNEIGVPATFYVVVECVAHGKLPWPARLRFAFRHTRKVAWSEAGGTAWPLQNRNQRESAYLHVCDLCCQLTGVAQEEYISHLEQELGASAPDGAGALMMNFEQVRGLRRQGHIVGSHTMTHPNLAHVSLPEAQVELAESKRYLEYQLAFSVQHFSYPCPALPPNWTDKTAEQSRHAGYKTAVTTDDGIVRKGDDPQSWKRIRPTKTVEGLRWNLERAFAGRGQRR